MSFTASKESLLQQMDNPQVVYYAFGWGMNHVTRAAAVLRQLHRLGYDNVLVLTDALSTLPLKQEKLRFLQFTTTAEEEMREQVQRALRQLQPDLLIVDAFPQGFAGELRELLPELSCRKVLLCQRLKAPYAQQLAHVSCYDEVLLIEELTTPLPCRAKTCAPIVFRDEKELLQREEARNVYGVTDREPLALAVGTGSVSWEADFFTRVKKSWHKLHPNAHLRLASLHEDFPDRLSITHYPIFELFSGADIIIGAAGYSLFHEVQASGAHGIFIPQDSLYDDQESRVQGSCIAVNPEGLTTALREMLRKCRETPRNPIKFTNGAVAVANIIAKHVK